MPFSHLPSSIFHLPSSIIVVTNVKTTKDTPEAFKPYLYKKGDVLKVKVNEVTDKLYRFTMIYQGKNRGCTEVFRAQ